MFTRRQFLKGLGTTVVAGFGAVAGMGTYAVGGETLDLRVTAYRLTPPRWPEGLGLRLAVVADLHACRPWMTRRRISMIVERTNRLRPDITLLLGDYAAGHKLVTGAVHSPEWSSALARLEAPLGVHAVLGNHDWWDDRTAQRNGHGPTYGQRALEDVGIRVYENDAVRMEHDGYPFWLAGLGDQIALVPGRRYGRGSWQGVDDLSGTLARIDDDAPAILMAHEPDIFVDVPDRIALTLSGHTHGGQVRLFGRSPVVPSRHGERFAYGHVSERRDGDAEARSLIVSGGLGCSIMPVRVGMPPEIVIVELGSLSG